MIHGYKATLIPNEGKDNVQAFEHFVLERNEDNVQPWTDEEWNNLVPVGNELI